MRLCVRGRRSEKLVERERKVCVSVCEKEEVRNWKRVRDVCKVERERERCASLCVRKKK